MDTVGIVALEDVIYAWHRTMHNVDFVWRGFHQIHHSPRRVAFAGSRVVHIRPKSSCRRCCSLGSP